MTPLIPINLQPRPMLASDLDAVISLQTACYGPEFHEPQASFRAKLIASPESCWVLAGPTALLAYLVSLPIEGRQMPALHATEWHRSHNPDWLYLHDLAIHPEARGMGLAGLMLDRANALAHNQKLVHVGLIAVQGSAPFWQRHGFAPALGESPLVSDAKLASFGQGATFMLRRTTDL